MNDAPPNEQIVLSSEQDFALGALQVAPSRLSVLAGSAHETLEPRVMQVLVKLTQSGEKVVSRDDLIIACWEGNVVSNDAIQRCVARLRRLSETHGGFKIETVPRVGYRLLPDRPSIANSIDNEQSASDATGHPPSVMVASVIAYPREAPYDVFAEILADDVAAALSLNRDIEVAARITQSSDPIEAATALGVDYVLTGQVRDAADELRIRMQVTSVKDRRIVATETIATDRVIDPIPSDDLILDISVSIYELIMREATQRALKKREVMDAWQAVIRSRSAYQRISIDGMAFAISEARRAVSLDPEFGSAHAALALSLAASYEVHGCVDAERAAESRRHADRALLLDPDNPTVLACVASALGMVTRPREGLEYAERAVRLAPAHPVAHLYLARQYINHGMPEKALTALDMHERVAPRFPWRYYLAFQRGLAEFMAGRIDRAEYWYEEASSMNPNYPFAWLSKAIVYGLTDRPELARVSIEKLKQLEGDDSLELQTARIANAYPDPSSVQPLLDMFISVWNT